ncbi:uncharacterized protein LOC111702803 [Eurytemora carolleeae]|uniref:uncharacterized protein LOC111702803 n=1 Tax=Eurytemora carolleeae TaxID=1294199 RepID=UPI000C781FDC|nr:uncharacterized protein LOC111702803 [Eurytemora carolleeae]|eukprot:XP_023330359.1 uncharacterized protein LOC111702803 [Eurytemora affinis]
MKKTIILFSLLLMSSTSSGEPSLFHKRKITRGVGCSTSQTVTGVVDCKLLCRVEATCKSFNYGNEMCELCPDEISNGYKDIGRNTDGMFFYTASRKEDQKITEALSVCPISHPFPFAGGLKCCEKNLADPANVVTNSHGYLTLSSNTCLGTNVVCPFTVCSRNQTLNALSILKIPYADLRDHYQVEEIPNTASSSSCQWYCETDTMCKGWYWIWSDYPGSAAKKCVLMNGSNLKFRVSSGSLMTTAGFKSSIIVWN